MKRNLKRFISAILVSLVLVTSVTPAFASEFPSNSGTVNSLISNNSSESQVQPRIPNIISLGGKDAGNDVAVIQVVNRGLDPFDEVSYYIQIFNAEGRQYARTHKFTNIFPNTSQKERFYILGWNRVSVSNIHCKDGTDKGTLADFILYRK